MSGPFFHSDGHVSNFGLGLGLDHMQMQMPMPMPIPPPHFTLPSSDIQQQQQHQSDMMDFGHGAQVSAAEQNSHHAPSQHMLHSPVHAPAISHLNGSPQMTSQILVTPSSPPLLPFSAQFQQASTSTEASSSHAQSVSAAASALFSAAPVTESTSAFPSFLPLGSANPLNFALMMMQAQMQMQAQLALLGTNLMPIPPLSNSYLAQLPPPTLQMEKIVPIATADPPARPPRPQPKKQRAQVPAAAAASTSASAAASSEAAAASASSATSSESFLAPDPFIGAYPAPIIVRSSPFTASSAVQARLFINKFRELPPQLRLEAYKNPPEGMSVRGTS
jgi:hypothetical protein